MSWVNVGIAAVGVVTSVVGGMQGSAAAKQAARAQRKLILLESSENLQTMYKRKQELLGIQKVGYAASGVSVDVGTPKFLEEEGIQNLAKASYYEAMKTKQLLKGASAAGQAASSGYLSQGISQAASFAAAGYTAATK